MSQKYRNFPYLLVYITTRRRKRYKIDKLKSKLQIILECNKYIANQNILMTHRQNIVIFKYMNNSKNIRNEQILVSA